MTGEGDAAVIEVLSTLALRGVLTEVAADFLARTGLAVAAGYKSTNAQLLAISQGATADMAIITRPAIDQLVGAGKIVAGSAADIAQSGVGLAVRAGAPKPDIATVEAFKRTLLAAKSVAYIDPDAGGSSGIYVGKLLQQLGIAKEVNAKAKLIHGGAVATHVVDGEAEIGIHQISEILAVKDAVLVGPLPAAIQNFTIYAAGVGSAAKDDALAAAVVKFLSGAHALPIIKAKGMEPAS